MQWMQRTCWLGVEINKDAVRLVRVERYRARWRCLAAVSETVVDEEDIGQALQRALTQLPAMRRQRVVASLPAEAVIRLLLEVDADMSDGEMEEWLRQETAQRMGMEPDVLALDFVPPIAQEGRVSLPVIASRCEQVLRLEQQLQQQRLKVTAIEGEAQAIQRICHYLELPMNTAFALLRLEPRRAVLHVLHDGVVQHSRLLPDDAPFNEEAFVVHVQRAWQFMQATGVLLTRLYVAADGTDAHIAVRLASRLGVSCDVVALSQKWAECFPQQHKPMFSSLWVALGLALWGLADEPI